MLSGELLQCFSEGIANMKYSERALIVLGSCHSLDECLDWQHVLLKTLVQGPQDKPPSYYQYYKDRMPEQFVDTPFAFFSNKIKEKFVFTNQPLLLDRTNITHSYHVFDFRDEDFLTGVLAAALAAQKEQPDRQVSVSIYVPAKRDDKRDRLFQYLQSNNLKHVIPMWLRLGRRPPNPQCESLIREVLMPSEVSKVLSEYRRIFQEEEETGEIKKNLPVVSNPELFNHPDVIAEFKPVVRYRLFGDPYDFNSVEFDVNGFPMRMERSASPITMRVTNDRVVSTLKDFCILRAEARGQDPAIYTCDVEMMWKKVAHNELTLEELVEKQDAPLTKNGLFVLFMRELSAIPSKDVPEGVKITDIIEDVSDYFLKKSFNGRLKMRKSKSAEQDEPVRRRSGSERSRRRDSRSRSSRDRHRSRSRSRRSRDQSPRRRSPRSRRPRSPSPRRRLSSPGRSESRRRSSYQRSSSPRSSRFHSERRRPSPSSPRDREYHRSRSPVPRSADFDPNINPLFQARPSSRSNGYDDQRFERSSPRRSFPPGDPGWNQVESSRYNQDLDPPSWERMGPGPSGSNHYGSIGGYSTEQGLDLNCTSSTKSWDAYEQPSQPNWQQVKSQAFFDDLLMKATQSTSKNTPKIEGRSSSTSTSITSPTLKKSWEPFQEFLRKRLDSLSEPFGIPKKNLESTSSLITRLMDKAELDLTSLRREYQWKGLAHMEQEARRKMDPYKLCFMQAFSIDHVVSLISDYFKDLRAQASDKTKL